MNKILFHIDRAIENNPRPDLCYGLKVAYAAIEQLLDADREFDEAYSEFLAAYPQATHTRSGKMPRYADPVVLRYRNAMIRRAAALAAARSEL
jgi:hypothetical protein